MKVLQSYLEYWKEYKFYKFLFLLIVCILVTIKFNDVVPIPDNLNVDEVLFNDNMEHIVSLWNSEDTDLEVTSLHTNSFDYDHTSLKCDENWKKPYSYILNYKLFMVIETNNNDYCYLTNKFNLNNFICLNNSKIYYNTNFLRLNFTSIRLANIKILGEREVSRSTPAFIWSRARAPGFNILI